jgi:hypothetical protein
LREKKEFPKYRYLAESIIPSTMQFTTLSVALFAALASANSHHAQHFHHRRGLNDSGVSTTLTVYTTSIHTITSCAATVTDCPARNSASAGAVVTDVIALTTVSNEAEDLRLQMINIYF